MVTRGTYYDEDEHFAHRYSNRGHGYPLNHERDQQVSSPQHAPYSRQSIAPHNSNQRQSPEQDSNSAPRRRIPVACGRCRKRKIRCSGDPGNGQPCVNCKTAGTNTCQFLRVSSTEAQMKNDGTDFGYDSAAAVSRVHCRMTPYGPQHQPYIPHITPLGPDTYPAYRQNSISTYQPIKYYGITSYNDFADENIDYGIPVSNYSGLNEESMSIPYASIGPTRWAQHPLPKSNSLFVDQVSSYSHLPSYSNPFPYRPSLNTDSKNLSIQSMATTPLPSVNGTDRVLPAPAPAPIHYRTAQGTNSYLRSAENPLQMSQAPGYSNNGLMSTNMINAVKALSASSSSESMASSSYLPLSSSPPESVPPSHMSYEAQSVSPTQNHDSYAPSHESHQMYSGHNDSSDNINYGISQPQGSASHRSSVPSQNEDHQSSTSNGSGALVNGYQYLRPVSDQVSYPPPPLPLRLPDQSSAQPIIQQQSVSTT